ncbi:cellulose biosynthesis cyclic di-GMP-binding regulatory protein BcsB [Anaerolineales bacterium HSG25]|nr:cellulose biosynthesis cyclic di-GMP-binding regulatory protein BcsB [Anaerolineales bacterium HSG25]
MKIHKLYQTVIIIGIILLLLITMSASIYAKGEVDTSINQPMLASSQSADRLSTRLQPDRLNTPENITWHTFLGSIANDKVTALTTDEEGRIYVVGTSDASWGEPINPHSGGRDIFVAKFSRGGNLLWNNFFGDEGNNNPKAIAVDADERIYISGSSNHSWGQPISEHAGQQDIFAARLGAGGKLQWLNYFGSTGDDVANDMAIGSDGTIYLVGSSDAEWDDTSVTAHTADNDAVVLQISNDGKLVWHSFMGGTGFESGDAIGLDTNNNIYIAGTSSESWGDTILNDHNGDSRDAFIAKLNNQGELSWNRFVGNSEGSDAIEALTLDDFGNLYTAGYSWDGWGEPVSAFAGTGFFDAFVAKWTPDGDLEWHTFMGNTSQAADADRAYDIAYDETTGRIYVVGDSRGDSWGEPLDSFSGERDMFVARLDRNSGERVWETFLGGAEFDYGNGVTVDNNGNIYVGGYSQTDWGDSIIPYTGAEEGFLVRIPACLPKCSVVEAESESTETDDETATNADTSSTEVLSPQVIEEATRASQIVEEATATPVTNQSDEADEETPTPTATVINDEQTDSEETETTIQPSSTATSRPEDDTVESQDSTESSNDTESTASVTQDGTTVTTSQANTAESMSSTELLQDAEFLMSLSALGYNEVTLKGPYDVAEYTFSVPDSWEISDLAYILMEVSFVYNPIIGSGEIYTPTLFGNIIVAIDGETQKITPIQTAPLINSRYRVNIPLDMLNNSDKSQHVISVALDTSPSCTMPHDARLVIHPETTHITFTYDETPLNPDLAQYPAPFNDPQFNIERVNDQNVYLPKTSKIIIVLPEIPNQEELNSAVAIAARLGNLGALLVTVDGMSDQKLLEQIEAGTSPNAHFVVIGTPDRNKVVAKLNEWGTLPTLFRERSLGLTSQGPTTVQPNGELSYNLKVTNSTANEVNSLLLSNILPHDVALQGCNPLCQETTSGQEVTWFIKSLAPGETANFGITVRLSDTPNGTLLENTSILLNDQSEPINVNTWTTKINTDQASDDTTSILPNAPIGNYFLAQKGWNAAQSDGIIQAMSAPWDAKRAILVVTGLNDEAVSKAGQAMGVKQQLPGLLGTTALVDQIQLLTHTTASPNVSASLSKLGYSDQTMTGISTEASYSFDIPPGWRLSEGDTLFNLKFSHSQLIDFENSSLRVLFNGQPLAEMILTEESSQNGQLPVELPSLNTRSGRTNKITVQAHLEALDRCAALNSSWITLNGNSALNLKYLPNEVDDPDFDKFPVPFNQQTNLTNLLFVLPEAPIFIEWREAIRIAALIGQGSDGTIFAPKLALGTNWSESLLDDHHLVAIGRPSRNALLEQINDYLLQPFIVGTDMMRQELNNVSFRSLPDTNIGVVQITTAPGKNRALLVLTGTTDEAVSWAGDALQNRFRRLGSGNLAFVGKGSSSIIDATRLTESGTSEAVLEALPEFTEAPTADEATSAVEGDTENDTPLTITTTAERPRWLIALIGLAAVLIIATFALAYWQSQRSV